MTTNNQEITYDMIRSFTENFDQEDSDSYIVDILNGDIDVEKMKSFILQNYIEDEDTTEDDDIKGYFVSDTCSEIYK